MKKLKRDKKNDSSIPYTDLAFLLMIFFLVTSAFYTIKTLHIDIKGDGSQKRQSSSTKRTLHLNCKKNTQYINGKEISFKTFSKDLDQNLHLGIQISDNCSYQHFISLLSQLKARKITNLSLEFISVYSSEKK